MVPHVQCIPQLLTIDHSLTRDHPRRIQVFVVKTNPPISQIIMFLSCKYSRRKGGNKPANVDTFLETPGDFSKFFLALQRALNVWLRIEFWEAILHQQNNQRNSWTFKRSPRKPWTRYCRSSVFNLHPWPFTKRRDACRRNVLNVCHRWSGSVGTGGGEPNASPPRAWGKSIRFEAARSSPKETKLDCAKW